MLTFLSAYIYSKANQQIVYIDLITGPIPNPMMGWAPWATIKQSDQPHTLVYADVTWREFEPQEGVYDFEAFEKNQQLVRWRQEGKRVVFRFVADQPGSEPHVDIPDWLFEKMIGSGDYYDNEYGKGFSPDYSNPVLIESHKKAIKALGEKYGGDDFFAFVELGSLGHWGEWHTHPELTPFPSQEIRNLYVYHYVEAFPRTPLLMRRPFSIAQELNLGLYNDMTADLSQTNTWLDWIENGGEFLPQERQGLLAMPNGWKIAPIGGEQTPTLTNEEIYGIHLEQTLQLLKKSHTTFIGPGSPYKVKYGSRLQSGIDQVLATIGYRLYIDHVQMPRWIHYGKDINIRFSFSNNGIAPFYYNWSSQLYLLDEKGNILATHPFEIDFRNVLPGDLFNVASKMPLGDLKNGIYSIGIAIIDPITGEPSVKFANQNARQDLIQYIGSFEVKRFYIPIEHLFGATGPVSKLSVLTNSSTLAGLDPNPTLFNIPCIIEQPVRSKVALNEFFRASFTTSS